MTRRSLVIGGRRGIGAAVVRALLARGDAVTFTYRTDPGDLDALRVAYPNAAIETVALDLADRAAVEGFAEGLENAPAYDAMVQVGGTTYDALAAMMDQDQAERAMQVNYFAFARIARAVVRPMLRARYGRIVAVGSIIGQTASQGNAAYGASKAALLAYVRTLAIESARRGITVNCIAPGLVDTEMMAPFAAHRAAVEARVPAGRFATPDEVAAVAAFLTTPEAGYVNGAVIPVDGGLTAGVGLPRN
jgi:3-oxoacyl-[acyl-carrier protein] reductase